MPVDPRGPPEVELRRQARLRRADEATRPHLDLLFRPDQARPESTARGASAFQDAGEGTGAGRP
jgi:hypothetical protein